MLLGDDTCILEMGHCVLTWKDVILFQPLFSLILLPAYMIWEGFPARHVCHGVSASESAYNVLNSEIARQNKPALYIVDIELFLTQWWESNYKNWIIDILALIKRV